MAEYCTVAEARRRHRIDSSDSDADITAIIQAASEAVRLHLRPSLPWEPELDSNGDPVLDSDGEIIYVEDTNGDRIPRAAVVQATLYMVGIYFRDRDGQDPSLWPQNSLPLPVLGMLTMLRDPILR